MMRMTCVAYALFRKHEIRRRFVEYDKDGDGRVTTAEAHSILQKELGFSLKQTADLVDHYDINKDGHLDYEEFVKFYAKVSSRYYLICSA